MQRRGTWLGAVVCAVALAGCGGGEAAPEEPLIAAAVAEDLAARSDAIADTLGAGDVCSAAQQADELQQAVDQAISSGGVPAAFRASLRETATRLVNEVNCPPAPEEEQGPGCDALREQKDALEKERKKADDEDEEERLEEEIAALEEQLQGCPRGKGDDDNSGPGGGNDDSSGPGDGEGGND